MMLLVFTLLEGYYIVALFEIGDIKGLLASINHIQNAVNKPANMGCLMRASNLPELYPLGVL